MKTFTVSTLNEMDQPFWEIRKLIDAGRSVCITVDTEIERVRTAKQNKSLHKYCQKIADGMNDSGTTQRDLVGSFKEGFTLPVTMHMIKDIFREVGKAMYKKESTAELTTVEMQEVYRVVDQRFSQITGVSAPWPSLENQMMAEMK